MTSVTDSAPAAVSLQYSFLHCRRITWAANSSFPIAFRLLPPAKRQAMDALYAFLRISDDLSDEPGEVPVKRGRLRQWRAGLLDALDGRYSHPIHPALVATVKRFEVPPALLIDALDGVESDLEPCRFDTFADLYPYCYRVASVVGLACVHIWGLKPGATESDVHSVAASAEAAGIAFQLTNILRDLKEDLARGRIYLPADELDHFASPPAVWEADQPGFRELMRFQVDRAVQYYRRGERLESLLSADGRAIFRVMAGTYRSLLAEIARDGSRVLTDRVRLPGWRKGLLLMDGWRMTLGWG